MLVVSIGCSGTPRAQQGVDPTAIPDALHYEIVSYPMVERTTFDLEDGWVVKRFLGSTSKAVIQARRRPAPGDWQDFGRFITQARVWEWKANYERVASVFDQVCDGESWTFSLQMNRYSLESKGSNAYPRWKDPRKTSLDDKSLGRLTEAFERLVGPKNVNNKST